MKKIRILISVVFVMLMGVMLVGCEEQADVVEHNLTQEADNFNVARELTVINGITDEVLFTMSGKMSITADTADNQLEVIVEEDDDIYKKHFIGLGDNTIYIIEDITDNNVSKYDYTLNLNPKMIWPVEIDVVD